MPLQDSASTHPAPRILVIEHQSSADPALIGERLRVASAQITVAGPHLSEPVPETLEHYDGLIVLGGAMGPLEDEVAPWLPGVRSLIQQSLDTEVPMLGICLGAQLLATVAGSAVAPIDDGPEVGLATLHLTEAGSEDPLLGGLVADEIIRALEWHWLEAKSLPAGSTPLITNSACTNQAFRIGRVAWGLQFHLEALTYTAETWSQETATDLKKLGIDGERDIISPVREHEPELRGQWTPVIDRWIELAIERRDSATLNQEAT